MALPKGKGSKNRINMPKIPKMGDAAKEVITYIETIVESDQPNYKYISLEEITLNPDNEYNQYDTQESVAALAADIERQKLLHNIVVSERENGVIMMLSGERRYKAYLMLREKHAGDNQYKKIFAQVRRGLTPEGESFIMDAANLQTRGGVQNEQKRRVASARFVQRLVEKFDISQSEAIQVTGEYSNMSPKLVAGNVSIENRLVPKMKDFYEEGFINKEKAVLFAGFSVQEQEAIAEALKLIKDAIPAQEDKEIQKAASQVSAAIIEEHRRKESQSEIEIRYKKLIDMAVQKLEYAENDKEKKAYSSELERLINQRNQTLQSGTQRINSSTQADYKNIAEKAIQDKSAEEKLKEKAEKRVLTIAKSAQVLAKDEMILALKRGDKEIAIQRIKHTIEQLEIVSTLLATE